MNPEDLPLRDLHLPAEIGWWPLAPGWWVLAGFVAVALSYLAYRLWRRWRRAAARRAALAELRRMREQFDLDGNLPSFVNGISTLLRRAMLSCEPRETIAGIVGEDWLCRLDEGMKRPGFQNGIGRCLADLPYRAEPSLMPAEIDELTRLVNHRLRTLPGSAG
jgi:hypothetical protein